MGMYTAFRGKVIIKEEYKDLVELINVGDWETAIEKYPFTKHYYDIESSTLLPYSKGRIKRQLEENREIYLEYDPHDWSKDSAYFTDLKGLEWTFITSLKDYSDEEHDDKSPIETFIDVILSEVVCKINRLQEAYEGWKYNDTPYLEYDFDNVVVNTITPKRD